MTRPEPDEAPSGVNPTNRYYKLPYTSPAPTHKHSRAYHTIPNHSATYHPPLSYHNSSLQLYQAYLLNRPSSSPSSFPKDQRVCVPARHAYSHSASEGKRYNRIEPDASFSLAINSLHIMPTNLLHRTTSSPLIITRIAPHHRLPLPLRNLILTQPKTTSNLSPHAKALHPNHDPPPIPANPSETPPEDPHKLHGDRIIPFHHRQRKRPRLPHHHMPLASIGCPILTPLQPDRTNRPNTSQSAKHPHRNPPVHIHIPQRYFDFNRKRCRKVKRK